MTVSFDETADLNLTGVTLNRTVGDAMVITGSNNVNVSNVYIDNAGLSGVRISSSGNITLTNIKIRNSRQNGLRIERQKSVHLTTLGLHKSKLYHHLYGYAVKFMGNLDDFRIMLTDNYFADNKHGNMFINSNVMEDKQRTSDLNITKNWFVRGGRIYVSTRKFRQITISQNVFTGAETDNCAMKAADDDILRHSDGQFEILMNIFYNNSCTCMMSFQMPSANIMAITRYNHFLDNRVSDSIIVLNASNWIASDNVFKNPESTFDVKVTSRGTGTISAMHNFWGSDILTNIDSRIFDRDDEASLMKVDYDPIMRVDHFECLAVNDCSNNGWCVKTGYCLCVRGWDGSNCSKYNCADVDLCSGHGDCDGPNQCMCHSGWAGESCELMVEDNSDVVSWKVNGWSEKVIFTLTITAGVVAFVLAIVIVSLTAFYCLKKRKKIPAITEDSSNEYPEYPESDEEVQSS